MPSIRCCLRQNQGDLTEPTDAIMYGHCTSTKIERWWRDLHEQMGKDIKVILQFLLESHTYDPANERDRKLMSYLFIPVIQTDMFVNIWNSNRIRQQHGLQLPSVIVEADLVAVAELSGFGYSLPHLSEEDKLDICEFLPESGKVDC